MRVEMRHLRTSPLSEQASKSSPRVPDALGLPLRGSVKQTKQPVAHPYLLGYNEACLKSARRLPIPRGLLDCATGLQGVVSTSGSDGFPLATQEISALWEMASQSCGSITVPAIGSI